MLRHIINGVHESVLVGFDSFRAIGRKEFCKSWSHGDFPLLVVDGFILPYFPRMSSRVYRVGFIGSGSGRVIKKAPARVAAGAPGSYRAATREAVALEVRASALYCRPRFPVNYN